jgi:hypothetical protein
MTQTSPANGSCRRAPAGVGFPGPGGASGRKQVITYDSAARPLNVSAAYDAQSTTYANSFGWFPNGALANVSLGPNGPPQQYCQNTRLQLTPCGSRHRGARPPTAPTAATC